MLYASAVDFMLDNRRGFEKKMKTWNTQKQEIALEAFDFAVEHFLMEHQAYILLKETIIKMYSEEAWENIEKEACERFREIGDLAYQYRRDVDSGRVVGYSAEEDGEES